MLSIRLGGYLLGGCLALSSLEGVLAAEPKPISVAEQLGVYVFPAKGQSPARQESDEKSCFNWAKSQSGIDPLAPAPDDTPPPAQAQESAADAGKGKVARGAVGGAAAGTAIGAIAGDTGKGAAIGATAGVIRGARNRREAQKEAEEQQQTAQVQAAEQSKARAEERRSSYNKAFAACLEGKGYSVK